MKITRALIFLSLLSLTACSTPKADSKTESKTETKREAPKKDSPETVMVIYHVNPGAEGEFLTVLAQAWEIYRRENLVFKEPHVVVREDEGGDRSRVVEIFTWVSHAAPAQAPQSVKDIWEKEHSLCENRNGRNGIEGGEVTLLLPKNK